MATQATAATADHLATPCLGVSDYEPAPTPSPRSACVHPVVGVSLQVADEDLCIHRHALTRRQEMLIALWDRIHTSEYVEFGLGHAQGRNPCKAMAPTPQPSSPPKPLPPSN